jgi:L-ribulose-5-phosphate 3-epimerase
MPPLTRRAFLQSTAALGTVGATHASPLPYRAASFTGPFCLFSKLLPELAPRQLARAAKDLGYTGIDLTVRPQGHVLPERAAEDLPKAVEAIRAEGVEVPMITTALVSAADPTARPILTTAARLGVQFVKPGYYRYKLEDVRREIDTTKREFAGLAQVAKDAGVRLGYHNHSGTYVGAAVWDAMAVVDPLPAEWVGYYFDVRHAVVEGGDAGWRIALQLVAPRLKMLAMKDFRWERNPKGGWGVENCPIGEGMVNWNEYAKQLARIRFNGLVSVHVEYDITGPTPAARLEKALAAARRDLQFTKARLDEAYART